MPAETAAEPAYVFIRNPLAGAMNLPMIGVLIPGQNRVRRDTYLAARDIVPWKDLPDFTVDDPLEGRGPAAMSADEAAQFALDCNSPELLAELRKGERRKTVLAAIEHQERYLALAEQTATTLKAMLKIESRPHAAVAIEKALERASE